MLKCCIHGTTLNAKLPNIDNRSPKINFSMRRGQKMLTENISVLFTTFHNGRLVSIFFLYFQSTYGPQADTCINECKPEECARGTQCRCSHILNYEDTPLGSAVQLVFLNIGTNSFNSCLVNVSPKLRTIFCNPSFYFNLAHLSSKLVSFSDRLMSVVHLSVCL